MVDENGDSIRAHLESIWRQTGQRPDELAPVECPRELKYIWDFWMQLEKRRQGHNPISWSDIGWWCYLNDVSLSSFEKDMLGRIEGLFFKELQARLPKPPRGPQR